MPPGPTSRSPLGHLLALRRDVLGFLAGLADRFGDVARFRVAGIEAVLVNHPDLIGDVLLTRNGQFSKGRPLGAAKRLLGDGLLTSEGELHDRHRRIMAPAFRQARLEAYGAAMAEHASRLSEDWEDGSTVEVLDEMIGLATRIAGTTLLNQSLDAGEVREVGDVLDEVVHLFARVSIPFAEQLLHLPLPSSRRFHASKRRLDSLVQRIIERGRDGGSDGGSLLSMLLSAQADPDASEPLTAHEVRDEVLTLLLTALDTTSLALTWTWHLLARHPDVEQRLHDEVDRTLGDGPLTVEDLPRLRYTRAVLQEAIRLYPPLYLIVREPVTDYAIADYTVPAGHQILMSPYLMQRDARFYDRPTDFDPGRWDEGKSDRPRFAYFPFGGGARVCIGEAYAWMEGVIVLATLARRWRLRPVPGHEVATEPLLNLRPRGGMPMNLQQRDG